MVYLPPPEPPPFQKPKPLHLPPSSKANGSPAIEKNPKEKNLAALFRFFTGAFQGHSRAASEKSTAAKIPVMNTDATPINHRISQFVSSKWKAMWENGAAKQKEGSNLTPLFGGENKLARLTQQLKEWKKQWQDLSPEELLKKFDEPQVLESFSLIFSHKESIQEERLLHLKPKRSQSSELRSGSLDSQSLESNDESQELDLLTWALELKLPEDIFSCSFKQHDEGHVTPENGYTNYLIGQALELYLEVKHLPGNERALAILKAKESFQPLFSLQLDEDQHPAKQLMIAKIFEVAYFGSQALMTKLPSDTFVFPLDVPAASSAKMKFDEEFYPLFLFGPNPDTQPDAQIESAGSKREDKAAEEAAKEIAQAENKAWEQFIVKDKHRSNYVIEGMEKAIAFNLGVKQGTEKELEELLPFLITSAKEDNNLEEREQIAKKMLMLATQTLFFNLIAGSTLSQNVNPDSLYHYAEEARKEEEEIKEEEARLDSGVFYALQTLSQSYTLRPKEQQVIGQARFCMSAAKDTLPEGSCPSGISQLPIFSYHAKAHLDLKKNEALYTLHDKVALSCLATPETATALLNRLSPQTH